MASLNTLRTKFGIVLSIVIAIALLAFILSLKSDMGFSDNDPKVGVIAGQKINYSEYLDQYETVKTRNGGRESDDQQMEQIAAETWSALFASHVLLPDFEKMGLVYSDAERTGTLAGLYPSSILNTMFADRTGRYDVQAVANFLESAAGNPEAQWLWSDLMSQVRLERQSSKFASLVGNGVYINKLETEQGVQGTNRSFAGRWAARKYATVPDSLVEVTSSEIDAYYRNHKKLYRQKPLRMLSYVLFEVLPTEEDKVALQQTVQQVGEDFAQAENVRSFARANRNGTISDRYYHPAQLPAEESEAITAGRMYGPVLKNNEWTMSRVVESRMAPDSIGVRHIVLRFDQAELADSLLTALRGGADFAQTAMQYSLYEPSAVKGGDMGTFPYSAFLDEFSDQLAGVKRGDLLKIESGQTIQILEVTRADKPSRHYRLATIAYPVEASAATRLAVHNQAGSFSVNAKGSAAQFETAASEVALTPRAATLTQGERTVSGLENSREIARWAYEAKQGDISEVFNVGKDYVVAFLTEIDNNEYRSLEKVTGQIRQRLLREKKFDYIVSELSGTTLDELAASMDSEVQPFERVKFGSFYANGIGVEPRLIGAIAASETTGEVSAPVQGLSGVYVFVVDDIADEQSQTAGAEFVRLQSKAESSAEQMLMWTMEQMAEIEDLRGLYF